MSEIQQTRYDHLLRRVAGLIGPGSKVGDVITELLPTFDVENMPAELLLLSGTRLCLGSSELTAAAGERPTIQLFNPVDSGSLITVTSFIVSANSIQPFRYTMTDVARPTQVASSRFRDTRLGFTPFVPLGQIRQESTAAAATATGQLTALTNSYTLVTDPDSIAVLGPGTGFEVGATVLAAIVRVSFNWRERPAEQSELQF